MRKGRKGPMGRKDGSEPLAESRKRMVNGGPICLQLGGGCARGLGEQVSGRTISQEERSNMQPEKVSISPSGEQFALPTREDYAAEFKRLEKLAEEQRAAGREIVVVVGLGFVGAVMAGV